MRATGRSPHPRVRPRTRTARGEAQSCSSTSRRLPAPAAGGYAQPQAISLAPPPAHATPVTGDSVKMTPQTPLPQKQPRPRRKKVSLALIACSILLLIGIAAFAIARLFPTTTRGTPDTVVGSIVFSSSANASHVPFNQIQLDLKNIHDPPQNMVYYAWIENADPDVAYPHWQLTISHGIIQGSYPSSPPTNLLANTTTFLITVENTSRASTPRPPWPTPRRCSRARAGGCSR